MNVLAVTMGADIGGGMAAVWRAFQQHAPGWSFRSLVKRTNYLGYPQSEPWALRRAARLWNAAEVVHGHQLWATIDRLEDGWHEGAVRIPPLPRRPYVFEWHGGEFRDHVDEAIDDAREHGAIGIVASIELWTFAPDDVEWVPTPWDTEWLQAIRADGREPDGRIRVAHAFTSRDVFSTDHVVEAVELLQGEGLPIDFDLIHDVSWHDCLALKAEADIVVDQVRLGYASNALEAMGMGIPVIAGAAPNVMDAYRERIGPELPFVEATEDTLADAIRALVTDAAMRAEYGRRGLDYVRVFHDPATVVAQLQGIYRRAAGDTDG